MAYAFKHGDRPLEGYTIQRGIGRGGFGEVYYAISDGGREVALKYLRDNAEIELRGVSHCMNLKSPHLVTIFDVKKNDEGEYFIIMEHVSGPSLRELLMAEPKGLGAAKAAFFLREIGKGLSYLHNGGIVHRDLKPANIFYEEGHVKIGDYGLSKFISVSRHSAQTASVGTVHYMAPEVGSGNYHRGIDIYALGVILYEMLLGKVPFEGSSMGEILMKHLTEQPEVQGLPPPFGAVICKALAKDPKDRYQTVDEMMDAMLEAGTVRDSLAGFNPTTITSVPRREDGGGYASPVPSPNPVRARPPFRAADFGNALPLPPSLERKVSKVRARVLERMSRLAGKAGMAAAPHGQPAKGARPAGVPAHGTGAGYPIAHPGGATTFGGRLKGLVVASMLTVAASGGLGLLMGAVADADESVEFGFAAGAFVLVMALGVRMAPRIAGWLSSGGEPAWVQKLMLLVVVGPMLGLANLPLFSLHPGDEAEGLGSLIAMLIVLLTADWTDRRIAGEHGEMSFGRAFSLGLWCGIINVMLAGMFDAGDEEDYLAMGALVGGTLSMVHQAAAWFLRRPAGAANWAAPAAAGPEAVLEIRAGWESDPEGAALSPQVPVTTAVGGRVGRGIPHGIPVASGSVVEGAASATPVGKRRSTLERGFFSVLAFIMLFSMMANIVLAAVMVENIPDDELMAHIVGAVGSFAILLFSLQHIGTRKRIGFGREWVTPILIAVVMTGLGASIAALSIYAFTNEELALSIVGIVMCGLVLMLLTVVRFWPVGKAAARNVRVHLETGLNRIDKPFLAMGAAERFGGGMGNAEAGKVRGE